ncbi:MAG: hypothetical protein RL117_1742 [Verrucomicrobiota bacterium]|jgi:hypothetical protein
MFFIHAKNLDKEHLMAIFAAHFVHKVISLANFYPLARSTYF